MKSLVIKTFLAACCFTFAPVAIAQQQLDIVQILGQFVQANIAASRCSKPDQKTLSNFLSNFKIVSLRATEELKKQNPGRSDEQIVEVLTQGTKAVEKAIDDAIRSNGCSDQRIQDLLKRFEMQSTLQF